MQYNSIDKKRIRYFEEIRSLAQKYNIKVYLFNTPLHPLLLDTLEKDTNTRVALAAFQKYLETFKGFKNLYHDADIYNNRSCFHGSTHTSNKCGEIILTKVLR